MSLITVKVNDEGFVDWLISTKNAFVHMTETMIRVAEKVKEETQQITPIETGRLSRSFKWHIVTDNSRMKVLQVQMSALNPKTGYDYAWIQHDNMRYKHQLIDLGFSTYRRSYWNHEKSYRTDWFLTNEVHLGQAFYLRKGIMYSESSAFEMIEKDYLSLFFGDWGHIY